ncbi:hypothetical protein KJ966_31170 [bacterium]|nr:hypothetical protein [bacterium]
MKNSIISFATLRLIVTISFCLLSVSSCVKESVPIPQNWTDCGNGVFSVQDPETGVNIALITSGNQAALVDAGVDSASILQVKEYLKRTNLSLSQLFITQYHKNHTRNLSLVSEYPLETHTPFNMKHGATVKIGDKTVKIISSPRFTSDNNFSLLIDNQILVAGDLFINDRKMKTLFDMHLELIRQLQPIQLSSIIPGYGNVIQGKTQVEEYLKAVESQVKYRISTADNWVKINDDIFISTNPAEHDNNMIVVISGKEASVIDVGSGGGETNVKEGIYQKSGNQSQRVVEFIQQRNLVLKNIIITHYHSDHSENLHLFKPLAGNIFDYRNINNGQPVKMGDKNFRLFYSEGHTAPNEHISIEINDDIIVTGDVLCDFATPSLLIAGRKYLEPYISTLETIKKQNYALIIPGHGRPFFDNAKIDAYLEDLYAMRKKK